MKILLRSAGACPCLLREYVRYLIGMIFYFTAHQNSICLSLLYAKFALPMDMTTIISEVTSPAFPIDMTIIKWIYNGFLLDYLWTLSYWYDYDRNSLIEMTELSYRNDHDLVLI